MTKLDTTVYWRAFEDDDSDIDSYDTPEDAAMQFLEDCGDLPDAMNPERSVLVLGYRETREPPPARHADKLQAQGWQPGEPWYRCVEERTVRLQLTAHIGDPMQPKGLT